MHKVSGIGGFFFRASDPDGLARWYEDNLGIDPVPTSYGGRAWEQEAGTTVFAAMSDAMDSFGGPQTTWAMNFRVTDLDGMVEQLRAAGIEVRVDPETYPNGRFASLNDPEGNPLQLWQPEGVDA